MSETQDKRKIEKILHELWEEGTLDFGKDLVSKAEGVDLNIRCIGSMPDPVAMLDVPELYGYFGTAKIGDRKYYVFMVLGTDEDEPVAIEVARSIEYLAKIISSKDYQELRRIIPSAVKSLLKKRS